MSSYHLVEHASNDYRLHDPNGNETGDNWSSRPDRTTVIAAIGVDRGFSQTDAEVFASLIVDGYTFLRSEDTPW